MMKKAFLFVVQISAAIESTSCNKPHRPRETNKAWSWRRVLVQVTLGIMTLLMLTVCVYNPCRAGHGAQMMLERLL